MTDHGTTLIVLNILLLGGFVVTAYDTFKEFHFYSAISMVASLGMLYYING